MPRPSLRGMRVLLCRTDRLGDLMLTLPAAADIVAGLPGASVAVLCAPENAPLARLHPAVAEVIPWRPEDGSRMLAGKLAGFSVAVACQPRPPALAWRLWREGIPLRVGTARRWWSVLFNLRQAAGRAGSGRHECELNRDLAALAIARLGGDAGVRQRPAGHRLAIPADLAAESAARLSALGLPAEGFAVLHAGSRGSARDWPVASMLALADRLAGAGMPVAWSVGPADAAVRARLAARPGARLLDGWPIGVLAAAFSRAGVVVANSTGPLHVAAAAGAPVVGLYPPVAACDPGRWGPLGAGSRAVVAPTLPGEPALFPSPRRAPDDLMERIAVDEVLAAVLAVRR